MQQQGYPDRSSLGSRLVVASIAATLVFAMFGEALAARRLTALGAFFDDLNAYVTSRWIKADGWANGAPFANAWAADHVEISNGSMWIRLDNAVNRQRMPYTSGEYRTVGFYGYGCYEARFRPIRQSGVVTSFFTFAGPRDDGGNRKHNEIDIEFLGYDTTRVQFNYWTNDDLYASDNAVLMDLGFDAAGGANNYGFRWTAQGIAWFVNGNLVHEVFDSPLRPTPKASESLQKIMMNVWPVDATASAWAGSFVYSGVQKAQYEWVRYDASPNCGFTS